MKKQHFQKNGYGSLHGTATPIFLKVLLFHLSGLGNHHDDATLNFISDSSSCMLGLSNEISFVSGFFLEGGKSSQNGNPEIRVCVSFFRRLYYLMDTARQNGFIYKVVTRAKDYQNLKVHTLRVQNNYELKSPTVEFFSHKFLSAPTGI